MLKSLVLLAVLLMIPTVSAWEIKSAEFDAVNKTLTIKFDLTPLERVLLFVLGGDYTKQITERYIDGNYTLISAGYDQVKLIVRDITFKEPTEVLIKGDDHYYLVNTTNLRA